MPTLTDPARELVDLCRSLATNSNTTGEVYLASKFGVDAWSAGFYEINFFILSRIDELKEIINNLPLDEDTKSETASNLNVIAEAFGPNGHRNSWDHSVTNYLNQATLGPLTVLSGLIRPTLSYPKLSSEERDDLIGITDQLLEWLNQHQLADQDFIRQALIDGVKRFRFRLERLQWIGWGYTIDSLREVIGAYFALERGTPTDGSNTSAQATIKMLSDFVHAVYEKTKFMKEITETGDFMLRAYGGATMAVQAWPHISGYLTG